MSDDAVFGPFFTSATLREKLLKHLKDDWQETYLAMAERVTGREPRSLPKFKGWETPYDLTKWPETQLPALLVVVRDSPVSPVREGDGSYRVKRLAEITCVCDANTEQNARDLASLYATGTAMAMVQAPSVGGIAENSRWVTVGTRVLAIEENRSIAAEGNVFEIEIANVLNARAGMAEPPADPYDVDPFPTVSETNLEVTRP